MPAPPPQQPVFGGDDEISRLLRTTDWKNTSLGPPHEWSEVLIAYVRLIVALPTPAILFWGPDQVQLYNAGYATIMGPRHPIYFGKTYKECWPDTYPTIYPWMRRVLDQGEVLRVEDEQIPVTRYGFDEEAYFSFTFSPAYDEKGAILGIFQPVFEVTRNVLAQRRAETLRALESHSDVWRDIQGAVDTLSKNDKDVPFALFYLVGDGGTLQLAAQSRAMNVDEKAFSDLAEQVFRSGESRTVPAVPSTFGDLQAGPWPEPVRNLFCVPIRPPGDEAHRGAAIFGLSPRLHFDENYQAFLQQVSSQLIAQIALEGERAARRAAAENQRRYLHDLFMQAPAGIAVLRGPEHIFELVNARYRKLIGEHRDVVGLPIRTALPELQGQPFVEILDRVYRSGTPHIGTGTAATLDRVAQGKGEEIFFDFVYQPMRDQSGQVEGILVFCYDVSEQTRSRKHAEKLMDELKAEHERKDEFLAMLAHELRNPLAAIHNAVQLFEANEAVRRAAPGRTIQILQRQTQNLTAMVSDLLDVSRVTRGQIALNHETLDVTDVLRATIDSTLSSLTQRGLQLDVDLPETRVHVVGDRVRLEQVFTNVLFNAGKYTGAGGKITIRLEEEGEVARLSIRDTGIGLEPDSLEEIFELFRQVERTPDRAQGGLGIGLTVARKVVELHGGTITAHSEGLGHGSEFRICLPLAGTQESQSAVPSSAPPPGCKRILIVDDNTDAAETLALLLGLSGHEVATAHGSEKALHMAEQLDFDAIFLDIGLPVMDGYEVVQKLRSMPRTASTRIAALTGYGQASDRKRSAAAGFDAHFVKPVDRDSLLEFLEFEKEG